MGRSKPQSETPTYPHIEVKLLGENSSVKNVLRICEKAMKKAGLSEKEVTRFMTEAQQGDYNHLLCTCMSWFEVA